ncbi:hypothetical protein V5O48_005443 [Marasmius crinis-equi]|uniref:Cytochrome P450 n=1 Tax=Marasmius crinis-equi TaxID=585013 RepID=A0ABR3FMR2_9AGAR
MALAIPALVLLVAWAVYKLWKVGQRESFLPPGPPTKPIIGNIDIMPLKDPQLKFTEWSRQYGDIYSLKLGPKTMVVVSGIHANKELLDKRTATTADRPDSYMVDTITDGMHLAFGHYTEDWKKLRKASAAILSPGAVVAHIPIQMAESTQLLYDLIQTPKSFKEHTGRYSNSVIMSILFGKRCPRFSSYESRSFYEINALWFDALDLGSNGQPPVDFFPVLKPINELIPERFAPWKQLARKIREKQHKLYFGLVEECEDRMEKAEKGEGILNDSFVEGVLKRRKEFEMSRELVGALAGVLLEGGSESSAAYLRFLMLMMTVFPDAQRKAHEELDRVIGQDRAPRPQDLEDLPYIRAVVNEVYRIRPPVPLSIPHATMQDEEYQGYILPKGTMIYQNLYGIFHNPEYFAEPEKFWPDRYLVTEHGTKPGVDDSGFRSSLVFGSGRRICPGLDLGHNNASINTMNLLWAFNFTPAKGPDGKDVPIDLGAYEVGIVPSPKFDCTITPRSKNIVDIVEREFAEATSVFESFEAGLAEDDRKWVEEARKNL